MTETVLNVRFFRMESKKNSSGKSPIYCRLTLDEDRYQFSTGVFLEGRDWDQKKQTVSDKADTKLEYTSRLLSLKNKFGMIEAQYVIQGIPYSLDDIVANYKSTLVKKENNGGVLSFYKSFLERKKRLVGKELKKNTFEKFEYVYEDLKSFIRSDLGKKDIPLDSLDMNFLDGFEYYLKTDKCIKQVTINKKIQRFRTGINHAMMVGKIKKNPFVGYRSKKVKKEVVYLTNDELQLLEEHEFSQPRLQHVKDLFLFSCYTGLAYNEASELEDKHIQREFDGELWIVMVRKKTEKLFKIPLLPKALEIIDRYRRDSGLILPYYCNQVVNRYLKEIAFILGIDRRLTHHTARKTFASTTLLYNNVPIEVVSRMLGHSSIKTTQEYYGEVADVTISQAIQKVRLQQYKSKLDQGNNLK